MEATEHRIIQNLEDGGPARAEGFVSTLNSEESTHKSIRGQNSHVGLSQLQDRAQQPCPHLTPEDNIPAGIHCLCTRHGEKSLALQRNHLLQCKHGS